MKKILLGLMVLSIVLMFLGWNSCAVPGEDGKKGKNGTNGTSGTNGENGKDGDDGTTVVITEFNPIITELFNGVIPCGWNEVNLGLQELNFAGIRFTNTSDRDITVYWSFDPNPNILNSNGIILEENESFGWYEVIDYQKFYWRSCNVGKTLKIQLLQF